MGDYDDDYAILSHTWEKDEITYKEMLKTASDAKDVQRAEAIRSKAGYEKVLKAAEAAANRGYNYVWVDTCCIDKKSSADLSKAINSMFRCTRSRHSA